MYCPSCRTETSKAAEPTIEDVIEWVQRQCTFAEDHLQRNVGRGGEDAHALCMYWMGQLDALQILLSCDILNRADTDQPTEQGR